MSNDIKAGDLVAVLNKSPCCGQVHKNHGFVFVAGEVYMSNSLFTCRNCGADFNGLLAIRVGGGKSVAYHSCRKIPPLSDLEDVSTKRQDLLPNEQKETV